MKRFLTTLAATAVAAAITIPAVADDPNGAQKPKVENPSPKPENIAACLRQQGLNPPAAIEELKPWLIQYFDGTDQVAKDALKACGLMEPDEKIVGKTGRCGEEPAGDPKARAAKAAKARQ